MLVFICIAVMAGYGDVTLGVGTGIRSYPDALDPYDLEQRLPVVYPQGEITYHVAERVTLGCLFARISTHACVERCVDAPQLMELFAVGLCGEVDLFPGHSFYGIGVQVQSVLGIYRVGPLGRYDNGYGVAVYGVARQRLQEHLYIAVRSGFHQVRVRPLIVDDYRDLILNSVGIDVIFYIHL